MILYKNKKDIDLSYELKKGLSKSGFNAEIIDKNSHGVAFGIVDMSKTEIESVLRENTHKKQLVHPNNMFILK